MGKTTLARAAGHAYGRPVFIFQCTMDTRPEDLLITPVLAESGRITYHASSLVSAMIEGGAVILDEANRMSEKSWASLAPLLDSRRYVESQVAGVRVEARPDFRCCVTMNDDASTYEIPEYILSRLQPMVLLEYPDHEEELAILRYNVDFAPEDLLSMCADFLQKSHRYRLDYSTRDGIHIMRYALKLEDQFGHDRETAFQQSVTQVLGEGADDFEAKARSAVGNDHPVRVIVGADRLDYTKGIPERIEAVERLLELHPEHRERVVLLQVSVPSRAQVPEYRALKARIDEVVGRVNGRFATASWSPIQYLYRSLDQRELAALYRDADVALVTPLRDGMNLVAKEYVACQVDDPGVLVLSRHAGAADGMKEALRVHPYDLDDTAEALHRALTMPVEERRRRMAALRHRETEQDVHAWVDALLAAATGVWSRAQRCGECEPASGRGGLAVAGGTQPTV